MDNKIRRLVYLGILAALAIALAYLVRFPIFPAASYLEYDMADVSILIGAFMFGPMWGIVLTGVVSVVQGITVSAANGWVGIVMHFIATGVYVLIAASIYRTKGSLLSAVIGLIAGTAAMAAVMIPLNLVFTVHFNGVPAEFVRGMIWPIIVPFNLIKAGANGIVAFLLYKALGFISARGNKDTYKK